jgi:glycine cleavage system H protein
MEPISSFVETAGIAVVGILIRFLIAVVGLALIALPLAGVFLAWQRVERWRERARGLVRDGTLLWKRGVYFAPGHTWLGPQADGSVRIGLDDLAQKMLPGARVLHFAPVGSQVRQGEVLATLEVGEHQLPIEAPTAGRVVAINGHISNRPELLHRDPYDRGWLASVVPVARSFERFPTGDEAVSWMRREDHRLNAFLESELGIAAADGGEWIVPPAAMLSDAQFESLRREFLTAR